MSDFNQAPPPPPGGGAPPPPPLGGGFPGGSTEKNNLGTWALVLGILSIVCCGPFTGIPAIFVGLASQRAQEAGRADNGNLGKIGWILGIIGIALTVLGGVLGLTTDAFDFNFETY